MIEIPLVSVIIPTYNNVSVVCQAIDCALQQSYQNLEVIVVDDGSTDFTEQLLKEKYENSIVYVHQENKGTGGARNTGVRYASGKFIQFLDADDLLDLDKINIQIRRLQNVTGKSLSYCDYVCCDIDDMTVMYEGLSPVLQSEKPFEDIMLKWETELSIPVHCFIFDAALFKEYGLIFNESLPSNEDWDCWMDIFALDPTVIFIDKVLAYYRVRSDSRCRDRVKMREGYISAINNQIKKNRSNKEVFEKLKTRKRQIKLRYRDVGLSMRIMERYHTFIKKVYSQYVPSRIQHLFTLKNIL
jgi:glycosyltransferase involved in cell wall biosynthesis